jgi:hypothetical protein
MNQHPPVHHPPDARYYSIVDESQLELIFGSTLWPANTNLEAKQPWFKKKKVGVGPPLARA